MQKAFSSGIIHLYAYYSVAGACDRYVAVGVTAGHYFTGIINPKVFTAVYKAVNIR